MDDLPDVPTLDALAGYLLAGRYRLTRRIATGGMAQVWEATDEVLTRRVAVKILHPHLRVDAKFAERFQREALATARLSHPAIVSVYDACSDEELDAIVMELVQGRTLRQVLDDRGRLETGEALRIVIEIADALSVAHQAGVVHRDIKPANILLSDDGRVLVADFGIATAGGDLTGTGTILGTAKYLAPEQVRGAPVDARTDIYALGVILYETLCGQVPFLADTETATALARVQHDPIPPRHVRADLPDHVEAIVLKAMARDPAHRYASAAELRAVLLAADDDADRSQPDPVADDRGDATGEMRPPATRPAPSHPARRRRVLAAALGVLAIIAVAVIGTRVRNQTHPPTPTGQTAAGTGAAVRVAQVRGFDPYGQGDGGEHDDQGPLAIDGNPNTAWSTEGYNQRTFGTKPGVGLLLVLAQPAALSTLQITSPTNDWSVEIYVAARPQSSKDAWGATAAHREHLAPGVSTFDLTGRSGSAVLVWITDLGDEPAPTRARIAEVRVDGT